MVGALIGATRLPVLPLIGGRSMQYPVWDHDVGRAVAGVLDGGDWRPGTFRVSQSSPMSFREILTVLAARRGRDLRVLPVPWQPVYQGLRLVEALGLRAPFRADSVLGLVRPGPEAGASPNLSDLLGDSAVLERP
jgi:uncharacterized protein YbjT (DUF2867 family)